MKEIFIKDLEPQKEYETYFVVKSKTLGNTRAGKPYLTLKLSDSTGEMIGRVWENALEVDKKFEQRDVVKVRGQCEEYQGNKQMIVTRIERISEDLIDPSDFLPQCSLDGAMLWNRIKDIAATVKNPYLLKLLHLFFNDSQLVNRFRTAPAAKNLHHAYIGGLLEHTVSICQLLLKITEHYQELDRDLLITAGIFHDIGKIEEFEYKITIDYSDVGRLLGHVVLGVRILEEKIRSVPEFPEKLAILLIHMVLSHHGHLEFGSAKRPKTREAFALYFADDLDAKINGLNKLIEEEGGTKSSWTGYNKSLERFIFKGWDKNEVQGDEIARSSEVEEDILREQLSIFPFL